MLQRLGLALSLTLALLPATAAAQVTTSQVTSPADRSYFLDDDNAGTPAQITVKGTSDGTTGDSVEIVCTYDGGFYTTFESAVAVAADGSFSATAPLANIESNTCVLRATAGGDATLPATYHRYGGPRVAVSNVDELSTVPAGPNAGVVYGWGATAQGLAGLFSFGSSGDEGLEDAHAYVDRVWEDTDSTWTRGGDLGGLADAGSADRRLLRVDGRHAFTAHEAATAFDDGPGGAIDSDELAGLPAVTLTAEVDGPLTTFRESSALVACPADRLQPTAANCPSWKATGVRLERTWTVRDGQVAGLSDVFVSADGLAHTVEPIGVSEVATGELGYRFPGSDHPAHLKGGVIVDAAEMGAGPFYFTALEIDDNSDGPENSQVGVVYPVAPEELRWSSDRAWETVWGAVPVPAGGNSAALRQDFLHGVHSTQVWRITRGLADGYAPPAAAIVVPAEGETVSTDNVLVAGTASDVQVASVSVNGVPAYVAADGGWFTFVPLALGENTLTATVTDGAGQTAQATRSVRYVEPVRERVAPAGITRLVNPGRDRRRPFKFRVTGSLVLPRDIAASEGCDGNVLVTVRAGKRILAVKSPPVLGNCTFKSGRFKFRNRKGFGKGRKALKVGVRFTGNTVLKGKTATKASFRVR